VDPHDHRHLLAYVRDEEIELLATVSTDDIREIALGGDAGDFPVPLGEQRLGEDEEG
jgi:hypothetical protein